MKPTNFKTLKGGLRLNTMDSNFRNVSFKPIPKFFYHRIGLYLKNNFNVVGNWLNRVIYLLPCFNFVRDFKLSVSNFWLSFFLWASSASSSQKIMVEISFKNVYPCFANFAYRNVFGTGFIHRGHLLRQISSTEIPSKDESKAAFMVFDSTIWPQSSNTTQL